MSGSDTQSSNKKLAVCLEIRDVVKQFPGVTAVANDVTKDVAHLLLGEYEAALIDTTPTETSVEANRPGWRLGIATLVAVTVATLVVIRRRKGSNQ